MIRKTEGMAGNAKYVPSMIIFSHFLSYPHEALSASVKMLKCKFYIENL